MNNALLALQLGLNKSLSGGIHAGDRWTEPARMARALAQVQREHGGAGIPADPRSITAAASAFSSTGSCETFRDLKYVCLGIGLVNNSGSCLLADSERRSDVLRLAEGQIDSRRRLRCFQALISSYWTFRPNEGATTAAAREGWIELRVWLRKEYEQFQLSKEPKPTWFVSLVRHSNLLSSEPCEAYAAALLRGDTSSLNDAIESLAIPIDSWVLEESVFAQMIAAAALGDRWFTEQLPRLLPLALGKGQVKIGVALRVRSVAKLVSRYAKCKDRPEHIELRDAAVSTIGNPWLRRTNWDSQVVKIGGSPDDMAREMINGWLKRRLIKDFFELLSVDGAGDPRRLDYWLRFEPFIEEMWFAIGSDARNRRDKDFDDFRANAKGRLLDLEDSTADNNAFVMRIGEYLAVEFGATGNAFYLFKWDSLPQTMISTLNSGRARTGISRRWLKDSGKSEFKLNHTDSASRTWEQKFDAQICPLLGRRPLGSPRSASSARPRALPVRRPVPPLRVVNSTRPAVVAGPSEIEWNSFVKLNKLELRDTRSMGGPLWVLGEHIPRVIAEQLNAWGFRPSVPKGWYKYL